MRVQKGHGFDGTQVGISGDQYAVLITTDDAPVVTYVQEGKSSTFFHLATGEKVEETPWLLAFGETEQEAWQMFWDENPKQAPAMYQLCKDWQVGLRQDLADIDRKIAELISR